MKKLQYGLLLILSMILFSVPVLAAKTYYLPSKMEEGEYYKKYTYNKYGHLIERVEYNEESEQEDDFEETYSYKYDKNGKRVSGTEVEIFGSICNLSFDKKQYLKSRKYKYYYEGSSSSYTWNKKGYIEKAGDAKYTYYYSGDGKLKKSAVYYNGKKESVSYYNKDGFVSKTVIDTEYRKQTITYEYKLNKSGLVASIKKTTTNNSTGKKTVSNIKVSYSKTKTDKKTYTLFINGYDTCHVNALL